MSGYKHPTFPFVRPHDMDGRRRRYRVAVVGAGPVGLTAALDLARHGIETVVLDDDDTVSIGSRAICYAKRTLEIWDRLGVAEPMLTRGVTWNEGRVFFREAELYRFSLRDQGNQKHPAFINLQQYHCEETLVRAADADPAIDLRWKNRVAGVEARTDGVVVVVETPDGSYSLACDYLIAADGARSAVRRLMGLSFAGRVFEDRFLIADVHMQADFPKERWFWFDPPFNPGQSALLHMQPDGVWRIDLQLGRDADPEAERRPERVVPRIQRMLGADTPFELLWTSVYTFQCRMLERFRHGRVLFAGDAAHQVSPFGARGANSGVQDVDNLVWKLALVLEGRAPDSLLDSYDRERCLAARENIMHSTRSTDFITPKGAASRTLRDATLALARDWPFARALVNSGRLSRPTCYLAEGPEDGPSDAAAGAACPNAPVVDGRSGEKGWLLDHLGDRFVLLHCPDGGTRPAAPRGIDLLTLGATDETEADFTDPNGQMAAALALRPGATLLIRPDQHVAGRWQRFDSDAVESAYERAGGGGVPSTNRARAS